MIVSWKRYWQSMVFAAGVSVGQLGASVDSEEEHHPPHVLMIGEESGRFAPAEVTDRQVLTTPLDVRHERERLTEYAN